MITDQIGAIHMANITIDITEINSKVIAVIKVAGKSVPLYGLKIKKRAVFLSQGSIDC